MAHIIDLQVNSAFMGKRKMLRKSLQHICSSSEIEAALDNIGLPVTVSFRSLLLRPLLPLSLRACAVVLTCQLLAG